MTRASFMAERSIFKALILASLATGGLTWGCEEKKAPPVPPIVVEPKVELPSSVDSELLEALKDAASDCKVLPGKARANCGGPKKNALVLSFNRGKRSRIASIPTFTLALRDEDQNLQALAASVLYASFRLGLDKGAESGAVNKQEALALFEATLALPDAISMQAVPAATHALMLSGQSAALISALTDARSIQVRTMAYRYMMIYGRLSVFENIKSLGEEKRSTMVLAAIESPRNMKNWTTAEQEAICPWAAGYLSDARKPVAGNSLAVMSHCAGEHIDLLIQKIEASLKEKEFSFIQSTALRDVCAARDSKKKESASAEQCRKVRALQKKAVESKDVAGRVRAMALSSMAYRWPDTESLKLARKLSRSDVPEVKRAAQQVESRLASKLDGKSAAQLPKLRTKKLNKATNKKTAPKAPVVSASKSKD